MFKNYLANVEQPPQSSYNVFPPSAPFQCVSSGQLQPPTQQPAPLLSRNVVYGMAPYRVPSLANYQRNVHI